MHEQSSFLRCRCGQCELTLCDPIMRYRLECLCFDCRQRGLISASKNPGNALPIDVINYVRGVDDYYFANGFLVDDKSRDLLFFSKLREDAFNTTAMSACCGTLMCGTHPVYEGASISVNADSCRVSTPFVMPNQVILFGCDFPQEKYTEVENELTFHYYFRCTMKSIRILCIGFLKQLESLFLTTTSILVMLRSQGSVSRPKFR